MDSGCSSGLDGTPAIDALFPTVVVGPSPGHALSKQPQPNGETSMTRRGASRNSGGLVKSETCSIALQDLKQLPRFSLPGVWFFRGRLATVRKLSAKEVAVKAAKGTFWLHLSAGTATPNLSGCRYFWRAEQKRSASGDRLNDVH
jgi:hypothetical protein